MFSSCFCSYSLLEIPYYHTGEGGQQPLQPLTSLLICVYCIITPGKTNLNQGKWLLVDGVSSGIILGHHLGEAAILGTELDQISVAVNARIL